MFSLIKQELLKQSPGDEPYFWLRDSDANFDIFFWRDENGRPRRFQIWNEDHLWEWNADRGWKFGVSDPQRGSFSHMQSPTYRYSRQNYLKPLGAFKKTAVESLTDRTLEPFLAVVLQEVEKLYPEE